MYTQTGRPAPHRKTNGTTFYDFTQDDAADRTLAAIESLEHSIKTLTAVLLTRVMTGGSA